MYTYIISPIPEIYCDITVAIAAPRIPSAGAPRLPKISTQFKNTFVQNDVIFTTTDIFTSSILLIQHIIVLLRPNKIYAKPIIRRYDIPQEIADKGNDKVANFILHTSLAFEPGKSQEYSCNGMILLGYIIEKIYGKTLEDVFDEKIKTPLGYTRSKFNIEINEPNAAICYRTETLDGLSHPWDDENIRVLRTSAGSGGQFFTLNDINKYAKAIMNKSEALYPEKVFDLAEQNYIKDFGEGWGLGWLIVDGKYPQTGKLFPIGSFGHCGHTGTSLFFSREKDMYVIILTNATRCLNKKNDFKGYDYNKICEMRADIHNAIFDDLSESGLI